MKRLFAVAAILSLIGVNAFSQPKTIHVPQDYAKVQLAINAAVNGDTVLVAEGTYVENLLIQKKIVLGSLFLIDTDSAHISRTILDGSNPSHPDSGSVILVGLGTDTNTVIKGFTLQNGRGTKFPGSAYLTGGGICIIGGGATIDHNIIKNNSCTSSKYTTGAGGIETDTDPNGIGPAPWAITNNTIANNTSASTAPSTAGEADGGGLGLTGVGKVMNNVITNNHASGSYVAGGGGAVFWGWINTTNIEFSNNIVLSNTSSYGGGGIAMWVNVPYRPKVTFANNIIAKNSSTFGSAISVNSGEYSFVNNTIVDNSGFEAISLSSDRGALIFRLLNNIIWNPATLTDINSLDAAGALHNCIRGGYPGAGNFSANPNFLPGDQVYRLSDSSYCIGRGIDSANISSRWCVTPGKDYVGSVRPNPAGSKPDVGAVEHLSGTPPSLPWQPVALQFLSGSFYRSCIIEIPSKFAGQKNLPVVFSLNGYGGDALTQHNWMQTHVLGDSVGFITVYPEARDKRWNSGISANSTWPTPNVDDVAFISAIIDTLVARYSIDTTRVYSCGMSNGGFMSLRLAGQLSLRIAAVASVSGVLTTISATAYSASRPVPVMLVHGTADQTVPYNGGVTNWYSVDQTMNFWKQNNSCTLPAETLYVPNRNINDNSTVEVYTYKSPSTSSQVKLYKVIGGGHEWPGVFSLPGSGVINYDIDANIEIWNFFKQFSLSNPPPFVTGTKSDRLSMPATFSLSQNFPNPFNPTTDFQFSITNFGLVKLTVFDLLGREVAVLMNEKLQAGTHQVTWNATAVSSGVYFYRLTAGNFTQTKKMLLMK